MIQEAFAEGRDEPTGGSSDEVATDSTSQNCLHRKRLLEAVRFDLKRESNQTERKTDACEADTTRLPPGKQ
jgi:hypothetical protein